MHSWLEYKTTTRSRYHLELQRIQITYIMQEIRTETKHWARIMMMPLFSTSTNFVNQKYNNFCLAMG